MTKLAKTLLEGLGYRISDEDGALLEICRQRAENGIRNFCNIPDCEKIPSELSEIAAERICGEFLLLKRNAGKAELDGLDLSAAVKQIVEGDVSVSFAGGDSDGERLDKLIERLLSCGEAELVKFRRIRWTK